MKTEQSYTIAELDERTNSYRKSLRNLVKPDENDPAIPESIFKYKPVTWEDDPGVWHTLLGRMPDEGIWTIGTSPIESMQAFDKELQARLDASTETVYEIDEEVRQRIHKDVFRKVNKVMGWGECKTK